MTPEMLATAGEALVSIAAKLLSGVVTQAEADKMVADALGPLAAKLSADDAGDATRDAATDAKFAAIDAQATAAHAHVTAATMANKSVSWEDLRAVLAGAIGLSPSAPPVPAKPFDLSDETTKP